MGKKSPETIVRRNRELVGNCEPARVFGFFTEISAIPRQSGNMRGIGDYLVAFARARGLEWTRDGVSNVVIRKPARRSRATEGVILQAHQDMVCAKSTDSTHDFGRDPIEFRLREGKLLTANGTTLGADNGMGMAMALAVLDDANAPHPPLEALFTVDEETDMKGARAVTADMLRGIHLINLDSEDLGLAFVSSAAGCGARLDLPMRRREDAAPPSVNLEVYVENLSGGHSGVQINEGLGNALVLLARVLADVAGRLEYGLSTFGVGAGGGADNAIPARAAATVALSAADADALARILGQWRETLRKEYRVSDGGVEVGCRAVSSGAVPPPLEQESRDRLFRAVRLLPQGVFRFAQDHRRMRDILYKDLLVETSCNLGTVRLNAGSAQLGILARGSVSSVLDDLLERLEDLSAMAGGRLVMGNRTAGWEMAAEKPRVQALFEELAVMRWKLVGVHAGLECGCLVDAFARAGRTLHAVSVGPTIRNPHSPLELLEIDTVLPMWESLLSVLGSLAEPGA